MVEYHGSGLLNVPVAGCLVITAPFVDPLFLRRRCSTRWNISSQDLEMRIRHSTMLGGWNCRRGLPLWVSPTSISYRCSVDSGKAAPCYFRENPVQGWKQHTNSFCPRSAMPSQSRLNNSRHDPSVWSNTTGRWKTHRHRRQEQRCRRSQRSRCLP